MKRACEESEVPMIQGRGQRAGWRRGSRGWRCAGARGTAAPAPARTATRTRRAPAAPPRPRAAAAASARAAGSTTASTRSLQTNTNVQKETKDIYFYMNAHHICI